MRESMFACSRLNPRHRARRRRSVSGHAGDQGRGLGEPEREPVRGTNFLSRPRRCGRVSAITIAAAPAIRPAAVARAAPAGAR